jgi:hypothetical protein
VTCRSFRFLARLLCGAALLIGGCLGTTASAWAGCGDYVRIGRHAASTLGSSLHQASIPIAPVEPHKPCSGPSCRRMPASPPGSPASLSFLRLVEWPCLLEASVGAGIARSRVVDESSTVRPSHLSLSVFHPPRLTPCSN